MIQDSSETDPARLTGAHRVSVTAGALAPEVPCKGLESLRRFGVIALRAQAATLERMTFGLPRALLARSRARTDAAEERVPS